MKKSWELKRLGEVCKISTGKWDANHAVENGEYRFFTCAREPMSCNTKRFSGECLVLPGNGANVGDVYYYEGDFDAYQRTYVISQIEPYPKYLFYHMLAYWKERNLNKQYGSATNFLKIGNFNEYEIPFPPLPEQQRIVGILDEAFDGIATAKANAEKNLQNARSLFESHLQSVFTERGGAEEDQTVDIKKRLPVKPLHALCDDFRQDIVDGPFGSDLQRKDYISEGVPVLKIQNVKQFAIELKKMDYVSPAKFQELRRHSYRQGDIVMTKLGNPLGVSAIVECLDEGLIVADIVRIRAQRINTKYLCYHLNSQLTRDFINSQQKGTTRPRVTLSVVRELPIFVSSPAEQQRIVGILDSLSTETQRLESIYQQKLAALEALKKSLLHQAFTGVL